MGWRLEKRESGLGVCLGLYGLLNIVACFRGLGL